MTSPCMVCDDLSIVLVVHRFGDPVSLADPFNLFCQLSPNRAGFKKDHARFLIKD